MTANELVKLGNDKPVLYRGQQVIFECLSMNFAPWSPRKQPLMATIRLKTGRVVRVPPSRITLP
jgi:hypothetical protein